ncbi:MAG: cobalamin-dependent protein [Magnetococcales bacterium]|nr:cobalamin-dependent protein [Magnetococcales bacterium]
MVEDISINQKAAEYLIKYKDFIADEATQIHWSKNPEWNERFGEIGKKKCREDALYHLRHLTESVRASSPLLYYKYLEWSRTLLKGLRIDENDLNEFLISITESLPLKGEEATVVHVRSQLENGRNHLMSVPYNDEFSFLPKKEPLATLARNYLDFMLAIKRRESCEIILNSVNNGTSIRDIYLGVFEPVQHEIGLLWQTNKISVATEHYATATTQWVMSQLYPMIFSETEPENRVIAASVGGELHEIGIRMVADLFEVSGWDSMFLGASVPPEGLLSAIEEFEPHVLALSVTIPFHLSLLTDMIAKVREKYPAQRLPILVGGQPFNQDKELWRSFGVQAYASNAESAVKEANKIIGI